MEGSQDTQLSLWVSGVGGGCDSDVMGVVWILRYGSLWG